MVTACVPADDDAFRTVGITSETLELLALDDDTRRGLAAVLSLKDPVRTLGEMHPEAAEVLKEDAILIGIWVDERLKKSLQSVDEVALCRIMRVGISSSAVVVSEGLVDTYNRMF